MLNVNLIVALFFAGLALPLAAGVFGLFGKNSRPANTAVGVLNILGAGAGLAAALLFLFLQNRGLFAPSADHVIDLAGVLRFLPAGALSLDMLAAYFLMIVNVGVLIVAAFAIAYLPRYAATYRFPWLHAATAAFVFGMQLTVIAGTPLLFLFAWETMSFAAYFLVIADREPASVKAGFSYAIMTQLGAACLVAGFAILSGGKFNALFTAFNSAIGAGAATLGLSLLLIGFGAKAGIFPFHEWLPEAHPQAPSSASALMSGVMLKVALYGFLRVLLTIAHFALPLPLIFGLLALALFTAFYGALMAASETDLKKVLAWSSVENLGLMFAMAGTAAFLINIGAYDAAAVVWVALLVHALCHTLFKSGLFMASGALISETHTRDLDQMGGLAKRWPFFSACFLVLALGAAALPPAGTFYGEWLFLQTTAASVSGGTLVGLILTVIISVFALAAGLAAFAMVKTFAAAFLAKPRSVHAENVHPLPLALILPPAVCAALLLLFGLALPYYLRGIISGAEGSIVSSTHLVSGSASVSPLIIALIMIVALVAAMLTRALAGRRGVRVTETWDCGAPITPRMEYNATGFGAPIRFFFRAFTLPWKKVTSVTPAAGNPWIKTLKLEHGSYLLAGRFIYRPISKVVDYFASRVKKLQSGVVQFYVALIVLALVATLIIAL